MFKYPLVPLAMGSGFKLRELLGAEFKPTEIRASYRPLSESRYSRRDAAQSRRLAGRLASAEHRADAQSG